MKAFLLSLFFGLCAGLAFGGFEYQPPSAAAPGDGLEYRLEVRDMWPFPAQVDPDIQAFIDGEKRARSILVGSPIPPTVTVAELDPVKVKDEGLQWINTLSILGPAFLTVVGVLIANIMALRGRLNRTDSRQETLEQRVHEVAMATPPPPVVLAAPDSAKASAPAPRNSYP